MPPPPVPFFRGGTLRASEKDGLIAFRPEPGYALWSPPAATILRVTVEPFSGPGWASMSFHGEFSRVSRPEDVVLAPVSEDDAHALAAVLDERLGLPRTPKPVMPHELVRSTQSEIAWNTYLTVVGTQAAEPRHFETADFSGCKLTGNQDRLAGRIPGKRYLVVGFYEPGCAPGSMVLGYKGPKIVVMAIRPEPDGALRDGARWWPPPPSPSTRGNVQAWLEPTPDHGHRQLEFSTWPAPGTLVVGALDGSGGQGTGSYAARASQLVLATLLGGSLAAGSANALNCYYDRDIDAVMHRTERRPLARHTVAPRSALIFGLVLGVLASVELALTTNLLAAALAVAAIAFYVVVYTILLRRRARRPQPAQLRLQRQRDPRRRPPRARDDPAAWRRARLPGSRRPAHAAPPRGHDGPSPAGTRRSGDGASRRAAPLDPGVAL